MSLTENMPEVEATFTVDTILDGFLCPVCGYTLSVAPTDFEICPSCGTEFGTNDQDWTYEQLRSAWLANGAQWWSNSHPVPDNWNPIAQVLWVSRLQSIGEINSYSISALTELVQIGFGGIWVTWAIAAGLGV
jgi:hypothetical protein